MRRLSMIESLASRAVLAVLLALVQLGGVSSAVEICWDGGTTSIVTPINPPYPGDGLWTSGENWRFDNDPDQTSPPNNVPPAPGDRANIGLQNLTSEPEAPATIQAGDNITVSSIRVGTNPGLGVGGHGKLIMDGGTLTVKDTGTGDHFLIGADSNRTGRFFMNDGTVLIDDGPARIMILGNGAGTSTHGIVDFQGGSITAKGGLYIAGDDANANRQNTQGDFTMGTLGDSLTDQLLNTSGANMEVGRGGTGTFTQNSGTVTVETNNLILGQGSAADGTYTMNGGKLETLAGQIRVGNTGKGTFHHYGGTVIVGTDFDMGNVNNVNSDGTYVMYNAAALLEVKGQFEVGNEQKGTFVQHDGTVHANTSSGNLVVGQTANAVGSYTIDAGLLDTPASLRVGNTGLGTFTQNGGNVSVGTILDLGNANDPASDGTYDLLGGTLTVGGDLYVGRVRKGTLNFEDGTFNFGHTLYVGGDPSTNANFAPNADGTLNLGTATTAPSLTTAQFEIGRHGKGVVNQVNGTVHVASGNLVLGQYDSSDGTYNLSGPASVTVNADADLNVANRGKGTFVQNGGTVMVGNALQIGNTGGAANTDGLYEISGGTLNTGDQIRVGNVNKGTFHQTGGTVNVGTGLVVGGYSNAAGADGTYILDGGTLNIAGNAVVGHYRTGRFDFIDSAVPLSLGAGKYLYVGGTGSTSAGAAPNADGTFNLGDGSTTPELNAYQVEIGRHAKGVFNHKSGALNVNGANNLVISQYTNGDATYNMMGGQLNLGTGAQGKINFNSGTGVFNQTGGTVTLAGGDVNMTNNAAANATYNLQGGTLDLGGGNVNTGPGTEAFNFTGGTLKNVGTFGLALTQENTDGPSELMPGASTGQMNIAGEYDLLGGTLQIELQGSGGVPGTDFDFVDVTGGNNALLDGMLEVALLGFTPDYEETFNVLHANQITLGPNFMLTQPGGLSPAEQFRAQVIGSPGDQFLQLTFTVPEPAAAGLAILGGFALFGVFTRRRAARRRRGRP